MQDWDKARRLEYLLSSTCKDRKVLVFSETKRGCNKLAGVGVFNIF